MKSLIIFIFLTTSNLVIASSNCTPNNRGDVTYYKNKDGGVVLSNIPTDKKNKDYKEVNPIYKKSNQPKYIKVPSYETRCIKTKDGWCNYQYKKVMKTVKNPSYEPCEFSGLE